MSQGSGSASMPGADTGAGASVLTAAPAAGRPIAENARTMVAQFSHAKLPVTTSHSCVAMMIPAATAPTIAGTGPGTHSPSSGANRNHGTTSCAK